MLIYLEYNIIFLAMALQNILMHESRDLLHQFHVLDKDPLCLYPYFSLYKSWVSHLSSRVFCTTLQFLNHNHTSWIELINDCYLVFLLYVVNFTKFYCCTLPIYLEIISSFLNKIKLVYERRLAHLEVLEFKLLNKLRNFISLHYLT